jgi:hypothetical protein
MKTMSAKSKRVAMKKLTFGDLVVAIYSASSKRKARSLLRFAVNAHLVAFPESRQFVIS